MGRNEPELCRILDPGCSDEDYWNAYCDRAADIMDSLDADYRRNQQIAEELFDDSRRPNYHDE